MSLHKKNLILHEHEIEVKSTALIVLNYILKNKKKKTSRQSRKWWITHLYRRETGPNLLDYLQFDITTG